MKKTLAAVLGVAMLTSTAFAVNPTIGTSTLIEPASAIDITIDQFKAGSTASITNADFSIRAKKITKGSNLIKEIKIDDSDEVVRIVLNDDMTLGTPKSPNLAIEVLSIKAKRDNGDVKRNDVLTIKNIKELIGYGTTDITLTGSDTLQDGMNKVLTGSGTGYGEVNYSVGELMLDGRAYEGDKIFIKGTQNANSNVLKSYPDADLRFVGVNTQGLAGSFNVQLTAESDEFIYKVSNNKLVASGLKWSDDDYAWTGRMSASTTYVISDIKLSSASTDDTVTDDSDIGSVTNPETGANDVVGVAAALAVVSLAAAGALTLKKRK